MRGIPDGHGKVIVVGMAVCLCGWSRNASGDVDAMHRFQRHIKKVKLNLPGEKVPARRNGYSRGVDDIPNAPLHKMAASPRHPG